MPYSEERLKTLLQSTSKKDFAVLYDICAPILFGFILCVLPNQLSAERALANTFVYIRNNTKTYPDCKLKILTWMLNIARKMAVEELVVLQLREEIFAKSISKIK